MRRGNGKKRTPVNVTGASASVGELTASMRMTVSLKPPAKPPWYKRVKDRNLDAMRKVAPWLGSNLAWELGTRLLGLKR